VQHGCEITGKIFTPARHQADTRLPEAGAEGSVQAITSYTGHLRRTIRQYHIVDGQIAYHNQARASGR